ncbi:MAG: endonuclease MutS2 [Bacteroidetes bacterium]|nr:endonuclease MutS2 [Bacteroidota bacterium]
MILPSGFEQKLGFDTIRNTIAEKCICELGRKEAELHIQFSTDKENILQELQRINEFRYVIEFDLPFPMDHFVDPLSFFEQIKIQGQHAELEDTLLFRRSLDAIREIVNFFKTESYQEKLPLLYHLSKDLTHYPFLQERIDKIMDQQGQIKDNASAGLQKIRKSVRQKEAEVSKNMQQFLKQAQREGFVEAGVAISMRNGRPVIPVPAVAKKRMPGIIHDESSSGKTVFIEPSGVVEPNNEIKELFYAEQREIKKILIQLADDVRYYSDELQLNYEILGKFDFLHAKAAYAISIHAVKPVLNDYPVVNWKNAIHPGLYLQNQKEGRHTVPLNMQLTREKHILVISGPNAGGKSVCLKTVALLQYMLQCGMLIPVSENSETGIFEHIFLNIGDEQSIENDLSTYSSHLTALKNFVKHSNNQSLILIDEFGTGTEPVLGGAIAEAVLEDLRLKKCYGVITTHYANLKHYATSADGIHNGAMLYDLQKPEPTYQLSIGKPGSSFAFEIARKIGLSEDILKRAEEKVGSDHIDFDKNLRTILRDKKYWEEKRSGIRQNEKKLAHILDIYEKELEKLESTKKQMMDEAKAKAQEIVEKSNKEIERTIREIRESQADKEHTKAARDRLEAFKEELVRQEKDQSGFDQKYRKLKERQEKLSRRRPDLAEEKEKEEPRKVAQTDYEIHQGDHVQLVGQDTVGEVMEIKGKSIMVAFGNLITTVHENKVKKVSNRQAKKITKGKGSYKADLQYRERKLKFKPSIDLRGQRSDEALQHIVQFIDEAILVGEDEVKILHGKGSGALRQIIRDYLQTVDVVSSFKDEHIEQGGAGITVVHLNQH